MLDITESDKSLFRDEYTQKNIRIRFPDGEWTNLTKENIYGDGSSFVFTESICSQRNLRFGLAEASVIKFDAVNVKDIKGSRIEAYCEAIDPATGRTVSIPLGVFTVDSCKKQPDMQRRKVIAYSGTKVEVSPLTMAKLSVPSLSQRSYKIDVDEILGQGGQHMEKYTNTVSTEFSRDTAEMAAYETCLSDKDGNRYSVFMGFTYAHIDVSMTGWNISGGDNPSAWYEIISYPDITATAWDVGVEEVRKCLKKLKDAIYYQTESDAQKLNDFVQICEIMLEASVEINIEQTSGKKKLKTKNVLLFPWTADMEKQKRADTRLIIVLT